MMSGPPGGGISGITETMPAQVSTTPVTTPVVPPASSGVSSADEEKKILEEIEELAKEKLRATETRHAVYKYVVGVYASSDYHMRTLRQIHRYYLNAANSGDPIAQYHLALFLRYLGDIVDPDADEGYYEHESEEWLKKAIMSDLTKKRVEELNRQLADEEKGAANRAKTMARRVEALWRVEQERLDMMDDVLIRVRDRLGNSSSGSSMGGMGGGGRSGSGGMMGGGMGGSGSRTGGGMMGGGMMGGGGRTGGGMMGPSGRGGRSGGYGGY